VTQIPAKPQRCDPSDAGTIGAVNVLGAILATALALASPPKAQVASPVVGPRDVTQFCTAPGPPVHTSRTLRLPALHTLPGSAHGIGPGFHPAFAPSGVTIYDGMLGPRVFVARGTREVGYRLNRRAVGPPPRVDWTIELQLRRLGPRGATKSFISRRRIHVGTILSESKTAIFVQVPHQVGLYRADLLISAGDGHRLAKYGEYLRVEPESIKARLAINSRRFRPAQTVAVRVENRGSTFLTDGSGFTVQHRIHEAWRPVKRFAGRWSTLDLYLLPPEDAGRCLKLPLPADLRPGRYRIVDPVSGVRDRERAISVRPFAGFEVLP
jgi:hypothetical protein